MIHCSKHPDREAAGMCVSCGKPFCEECLVEVAGKMHCKTCVASTITSHSEEKPTVSGKSKSIAFLLAFFLGMFGAHHFYLGRTGRGVVYLLMNILLFWTILVPFVFVCVVIADIIQILCNYETDVYGRPLV